MMGGVKTKRMSSSDDSGGTPRKRAKNNSETKTTPPEDVSELENISWYAPFSPLTDLSKSSILSLREALRIDNLMGTEEFHVTRRSQQIIGQRSSGVVENNGDPGLVYRDLCLGQENITIPVTNDVDDPPVAPRPFKYLKHIEVAEDVDIPVSAEGCKCKGKCTNPTKCLCAKLNGEDFPYVRKRNGGGRLVEPRAVVFECGPNCGCGPECVNRTSQQGLKYRLEVYKTDDKGWAVRSWDYIPSGAFVCEYTGVVRKTKDVDSVDENDYVFEIDCEHTMNGIGGREKRLVDVPIPNGGCKVLSDESDPEFSIDAGSAGNVARFINHSCEPNLFVQCILNGHHDVQLARIGLFAADDIRPMEELTYDYAYETGSVVVGGKVKELPCHCGTADCKKRLY